MRKCYLGSVGRTNPGRQLRGATLSNSVYCSLFTVHCSFFRNRAWPCPSAGRTHPGHAGMATPHVVVLGPLIGGGLVPKGCEAELDVAALESEGGVDAWRCVERDLVMGSLAKVLNVVLTLHEGADLLLLVAELHAVVALILLEERDAIARGGDCVGGDGAGALRRDVPGAPLATL
eukprot:5372528-Prymnesium_polylepis.1